LDFASLSFQPPNNSFFHHHCFEPKQEAAEEVQKPENEVLNAPLSKGLAACIKALWKDEAIKKAYERQSEFQLYDCAA